MVDVIVVGAGPSGSVTAALLARLGHLVEIWERESFPRHRIGESLPPRTIALLTHLGFDTPGFAVMEGHTSIWGSAEPHRAVFENAHGLQVERDRFDEMLLRQSGVAVQFGRSATGFLRDGQRISGVRSSAGDVRCRFVVMATGPVGPGKASRDLKQSAIYGYWRNSRHPEGSQANDTIIEAFPDGWVWSLRLSSGARNVTVLFDKGGLRYEEAIQKTTFVRGLIESADLIAKPTGCDASWQRTEVFAQPGMLRVGDAASVIDPLSSQGVYKALCSAVTAATVINTCLEKPEMESAALDFYNAEERRAYDGYSAGGVASFRAEQRWPDQPFWKTRHSLSLWDIKPREFSRDVANAIETGRAGDLRLQNASGTRVAQRATMSGPFITLANYVVSATFDYGYRGPHAATMLDIHCALAQPKTVKDLVAGSKRTGSSTLLKVIAYMYREGLILDTL
jgi:flavin-dependent dehydrogenase